VSRDPFLSQLVSRLLIRLFARWRHYAARPGNRDSGYYSLSVGQRGTPLLRLYPDGRADWFRPETQAWSHLHWFGGLTSFSCSCCVARAQREAKAEYLRFLARHD
jgi:hypothetical protein